MKVGSLNRVMIMGFLGRDCEVKFTQSGKPVANFSVGTSMPYKDKNGEWQDKTSWHRVVLWDQERYHDDLVTGALVYIEGRLETRSYESDGRKVYVTEIIADKCMPIAYQKSNRGDGSGQRRSSGGNSGGGNRRAANDSRRSNDAPPLDDDFDLGIPEDDDVPF